MDRVSETQLQVGENSPSTCKSQYCGEPPWPRSSVLGLRPTGLEFRILCRRTVSSQSSHHTQEGLLAKFSLYVHNGGLKPDSFHFIWITNHCIRKSAKYQVGLYGKCNFNPSKKTQTILPILYHRLRPWLTLTHQWVKYGSFHPPLVQYIVFAVIA